MTASSYEDLLRCIGNGFPNIASGDKEKLFLCLTSLRRDYHKSLEVLFSVSDYSINEAISRVCEINHQEFIYGLDEHKKTISVWWHPTCLGSQMVPIALRLGQLPSYNYVSLISLAYLNSNAYVRLSEFQGANYLAVVDDDALKTIANSLDLIIFGEDYFSSTLLPSNVIRVCQPHGLDIPLHTSLVKYGGGLVFDYILCPMVEKYEREDKYKVVFPGELVEHASNVTYAVPLGYPKLDSFIKYCKNSKRRKKIVYHISLLGVESSEVRNNIGRILGLLLNTFQDREIMFRPDPSDLKKKELLSQIAQYNDHPRFSISCNSSYIEDYADAEVLVTHRKVTAHTFAYATGRPIVVYPSKNYYKDDIKNLLGYTVYSDRELIEKIKICLFDTKNWSKKINSILMSRINNPGCSMDYLVKSLPLMLERKCASEWGQYVLHEVCDSVFSAELAYEKILVGVRKGYKMSCIAEAAIKKYPEDASLKWATSQVYAAVPDPFESVHYFKYWYKAIKLAFEAHSKLEQIGSKTLANAVRNWLLAKGLDMALSVKWFLIKGPQEYGESIDTLIEEIMKLDTHGYRFRDLSSEPNKSFINRVVSKLGRHFES